MNYIKVTYPVGSSFIKSTFEDNSSYIKTSVNSTFIKVSYDGGSSGLDAERLRTKVYNVTGATLTKGTVVYINGTHGNLPSVTKAIATGDATSAQTLGLVMEDILDNKSGYIIIAGKLSDLDTQAFANGAQLYLSSTVAGTYTTTKQYAPAHLVYVGIINRSHPTQGEIEVKIQNGYEADEIHDFAVRNPLNNQGIFFNSTTSLWEKKYVSDALGYTPANSSTTLTINGVTFDLSQNRSWTIAAGISGSGTINYIPKFTSSSVLGDSNLISDSTGDLGIGVSPFNGANATNSLEVGGYSLVVGNFCSVSKTSPGSYGAVGSNYYLDSSGQIRRKNGDWVSVMDMPTGGFAWRSAGVGAANTAITLTQIMGLSNSGNLLLGSFTDDTINKLQVSGSAKFTSDILVNGINIGLGAGNVASNLRFGGSALLSNTTGAGNVALGYAAMYYNTGGSNNMAIGVQALVGNSTGDNNVAVGTAALFGNTNGYNNVAIGHWAAYDSVGSLSNSVGANNIFIGYGCLGESGIESNRTWIGNASTTSTWLGGNLLLGKRTNSTERLQVVGNVNFGGATGLTWDDTNKRLGIGTNAPANRLVVFGSGTSQVRIGVNDTAYWEFGRDNATTGDLIFTNNVSGVAYIGFRVKQATGRFIIGSNDDNGQRLQVYGDTLLRGSGATSATTALTVQNSSSVNILQVLNNGYVRLGNLGNSAFRIYSSSVAGGGDVDLAGEFLTLNSRSGTTDTSSGGFIHINGVNASATSGTQNVLSVQKGFAPTSGNAVHTSLIVNPNINQTGGANGITRGLYVNPTLTAAADFRAIETSAGNVLFGTNFFWDNAQGRLGLGTNAPTVRLQVSGDTILRGSGATSGTTALTVQNSASTDLFVVRNDGSGFLKRAGNSSGFYIDTNGEFIRGGASGNISLGFGSGSFRGFFQFAQNHDNGNGDNWYFGYSTSSLSNTSTTGTNNFIGIQGNFRPTSGTASYSQLTIYPTINQTGGANGITRGFYINPTLTAAADWRSIQWDNNTGWGIYGAGTADNYLAGDLSIGTLTTTDWLNIGASTTAKAHIFLTAGVDPTSPANGDIWFDGTNLKMRVGGVTRTFTLV